MKGHLESVRVRNEKVFDRWSSCLPGHKKKVILVYYWKLEDTAKDMPACCYHSLLKLPNLYYPRLIFSTGGVFSGATASGGC